MIHDAMIKLACLAEAIPEPKDLLVQSPTIRFKFCSPTIPLPFWF